MFFVALAIDYDGTLARDGRVENSTVEVIREVRQSGRRLILVTGRELADLKRVFTQLELSRQQHKLCRSGGRAMPTSSLHGVSIWGLTH